VSVDMKDPAALVVDGRDVAGAAGGHVAQPAAVCAAEEDNSIDPMILGQFRTFGSYYSHVAPVEVADGVPLITDQDL